MEIIIIATFDLTAEDQTRACKHNHLPGGTRRLEAGLEGVATLVKRGNLLAIVSSQALHGKWPPEQQPLYLGLLP